MPIKLSLWWKDLITKLLLLYAAFKVVANGVTIFQGYFNVDNPLIPDYLGDYIAFPLYFLIAIWSVFFVVCLRLILRESRLEKWFYLLLVVMGVYQSVEYYLYQYLVAINPYG